MFKPNSVGYVFSYKRSAGAKYNGIKNVSLTFTKPARMCLILFPFMLMCLFYCHKIQFSCHVYFKPIRAKRHD